MYLFSPAGLATGVMLDELDLFEHMNVGKDRAKHDWTVGNVPEAVLKDYKVAREMFNLATYLPKLHVKALSNFITRIKVQFLLRKLVYLS